jgi:hypothetical protein
MEGSITWVGIDAHKKTLAVAVLGPDGCPQQFTVANTERDVRKLARRLTGRSGGAEVRVGPEGHWPGPDRAGREGRRARTWRTR